MLRIAKSTDSAKKKELWKVFRKNRKELFAYTVHILEF